MYLQNTYIKDKFMASTILYMHDASKVRKNNRVYFNLALHWCQLLH